MAILAQAAVARFLLRADENQVYVLGHPFGRVCALQSQFGLPCPTCGMTRSVVLSLHGELARAWHLAPGGPAVVLGLLAFAMALVALAIAQWTGATRWESGARSWIRQGALLYSAAAAIVWAGGWALRFSVALAKLPQ